jgi:hypothetical protein
MIDRKEAIEAYRTLKQYCKEHPDCSECIFAHWYVKGYGECEFKLYSYPVEWTGRGRDEDE